MGTDKDLQEVSLTQKPWWAQRATWTVLLVLLVLAAGGYGAYMYFTHKPNESAYLQKLFAKADDSYSKGNYDSAIAQLKLALPQAKTDEQKVKVYDELARAEGSKGELKLAIGYMQKKHALAPDTAKVDSEQMASYYERLGDVATAKKLYNAAIAYQESLPKTQDRQRMIDGLKVYVEQLDTPQVFPEAPRSEP